VTRSGSHRPVPVRNCYPYSMVRNTYTSRMTSKGQITVPQEIRQRLGLREGDRIEFVAEDRRTIVRRAQAKENPFEEYVGVLGTFPKGKKQINEWVRDMRDEK
jgi:antitoxin PrlF